VTGLKIIAALFLLSLLLAVVFYRKLRVYLSRSAMFSIGAFLVVLSCGTVWLDFVKFASMKGMAPMPLTALPAQTATKSALPDTMPATFSLSAREGVFALSTKDLYRKAAPSVVLVHCPGKGYGTGFFFGSSGIVVTNHHVMRGVTQAEVMTHRGQKYPVNGIVAEDPINDVILLSTGVPPEEIQSLAVDSSGQDPGDRVVVISRHKVFANALSEGTVSATTIQPWVGLRLTVPLTYGASGSPVFNSKGEVVAIIRGGDRQDDKIGYAVPAARLTALTMKDPYPLSQIAVVESAESKALGRSSAWWVDIWL
jgi:S1-C subfamily serine protease